VTPSANPPAPVMRRRQLLALLGASALAARAEAAAPPGPAIAIYKAWGCSCCEGWIAHMTRAGFRPTVTTVEDLSPMFRKHGVPFELSSCHMGLTGGYVTVGHVPAADVTRLLHERPKAIGLSVPGMPDGSPGMERPDGVRDPYATLLILPAGKTRVWARHA
jgi:hypothetical protein